MSSKLVIFLQIHSIKEWETVKAVYTPKRDYDHVVSLPYAAGESGLEESVRKEWPGVRLLIPTMEETKGGTYIHAMREHLLDDYDYVLRISNFEHGFHFAHLLDQCDRYVHMLDADPDIGMIMEANLGKMTIEEYPNHSRLDNSFFFFSKVPAGNYITLVELQKAMDTCFYAGVEHSVYAMEDDNTVSILSGYACALRGYCIDERNVLDPTAEESVEFYPAHPYVHATDKAVQPKHSRVAVFASFNRSYRISEDVIFQLKALRDVVDAIAFVADHSLADEDRELISGLAEYVECERHSEYDFGSYKRGYLYFHRTGMLDKVDEVLFCNDSYYGPMIGFETILKSIHQNAGHGIYGLTINWQKPHPPHVQSYFFLLPSKVFRQPWFHSFITSVKKEKTKEDVVKHYEIGLSSVIAEHGGTMWAYWNQHSDVNVTMYQWKNVLRETGTFKKSAVSDGFATAKDAAEEVRALFDYPAEWITKPQTQHVIVLKEEPRKNAGGELAILNLSLRSGLTANGKYLLQILKERSACVVALISPYMGKDDLDKVLELADVCYALDSFGGDIRTLVSQFPLPWMEGYSKLTLQDTEITSQASTFMELKKEAVKLGPLLLARLHSEHARVLELKDEIEELHRGYDRERQKKHKARIFLWIYAFLSVMLISLLLYLAVA